MERRKRSSLKTFDEIVAEARRAGVLKFCAYGIAVLENDRGVAAVPSPRAESDKGEDSTETQPLSYEQRS